MSVHRFAVHDAIYVRPILHSFDEHFVVTEAMFINGFPHYRCVDPHGFEWVVSQIETSPKPFPELFVSNSASTRADTFERWSQMGEQILAEEAA